MQVKKVNIMSWNTQLYEYGNLKEKEDDGLKQYNDSIRPKIFEYLKKENPIVILQEIPFKIKSEKDGWRKHRVYEEFKKNFIDDESYDVLCFNNDKKYHKKMTVVIANKGSIEKADDLLNNLFISFRIIDMNLKCLALHAHNADEVRENLARNNLVPDMLFGDFNAGNYIKDMEDKKFVLNRQNYLLLLEGYIDLVQGKYTTKYYTQIDHILFRNQFELHKKFDYSNCDVDTTLKVSDHYPIHCTLTERC